MTPAIPRASSMVRLTRFNTLAAEMFPHMINPPVGLDESVVGRWCMQVKFSL